MLTKSSCIYDEKYLTVMSHISHKENCFILSEMLDLIVVFITLFIHPLFYLYLLVCLSSYLFEVTGNAYCHEPGFCERF